MNARERRAVSLALSHQKDELELKNNQLSNLRNTPGFDRMSHAEKNEVERDLQIDIAFANGAVHALHAISSALGVIT